MTTTLSYFVNPTNYASSFRELIRKGGAQILEEILDEKRKPQIYAAVANPRYYDYDANTYIVDFLQRHGHFWEFFCNYLDKGKILVRDSNFDLPWVFDVENAIWLPQIVVPQSYNMFKEYVRIYFSKKHLFELNEGTAVVRNARAREFYDLANYYDLIE